MVEAIEKAKAIEIENLSFSYPDGHQALKNITLTIYLGETVAIVGPNGAGKSTLLLHLNGILRGNSVVKIMGLPVEEKNLKEIRCKVGLVFQEPEDKLFSPTVFEDVAFGPMNMGYSEVEVRERVAQALKWVGMSGYEGRSSHHLSLEHVSVPCLDPFTTPIRQKSTPFSRYRFQYRAICHLCDTP